MGLSLDNFFQTEFAFFDQTNHLWLLMVMQPFRLIWFSPFVLIGDMFPADGSNIAVERQEKAKYSFTSKKLSELNEKQTLRG